jgi:hypothetical protein
VRPSRLLCPALDCTALHCMSVPPAKATHLLRALLREATYLPDAVARQYFRRYIVHRFKAYQPRENATASLRSEDVERYRHRSFKRRQLSIIHARTSKLQQKAQKGLHYLRRANQGEIPCLQKVLFFAYGRMGRRKYALLSDVLKPDALMDGGRVLAAADMDGPTPLQELYFSSKQCLQYFDAPKPASNGYHVINISDRYPRLRAVLKSQCQRGLSIHRDIKGPAMKTPSHNVWMRPMPIVRARNNVCRWYAQTMDRLLPPLPPAEWDQMRAMVYGEERVSFVKRRAAVASSAADVEDPLASIFRGLRPDKLSKADTSGGISRPHTITLKFMQRLYSRILQLCCKVEYNEERKHWTVVWGKPIQAIKPSLYRLPTDASLFAGVDAKGKLLQQPKAAKVEPDVFVQPQNSKGEYTRFPFFAEYLPEEHPMRKDLDAFKRKRAAAGDHRESRSLRGR